MESQPVVTPVPQPGPTPRVAGFFVPKTRKSRFFSPSRPGKSNRTRTRTHRHLSRCSELKEFFSSKWKLLWNLPVKLFVRILFWLEHMNLFCFIPSMNIASSLTFPPHHYISGHYLHFLRVSLFSNVFRAPLFIYISCISSPDSVTSITSSREHPRTLSLILEQTIDDGCYRPPCSRLRELLNSRYSVHIYLIIA